jgi:fatty acid-binding protein DegV
MDVLNIFESILLRYVSTIGLKPYLISSVEQVQTPLKVKSNEPLYIRRPEPSSDKFYNIEKLNRTTSLSEIGPLPPRSGKYVEKTVPMRIGLNNIVD